jgi:hypothetical protein
MNLKISKAYTGQASDLVRTLVQSRKDWRPDKEVFIEDTKNQLSYISNYWSPIQNLKFIADRAVTKDTTRPRASSTRPRSGLRVRILEHARVSPNPLRRTSSRVGGMNNVEKGMSRIEKVWIDTGFDYIDRLNSGAFGNRSLLVDPYNKTYNYGYYDFVDAFAKQNHLNPQSFATDSSTRRLNSMFRTRVVPSRTWGNMKTEASDQWFKQRVTELASMNAFNIQIEVPGRLDMIVGHVVDVFLYAGQIPNDGSSRNDFNEMIDKVYSGRYLITGIRHTLDKKRHTMNLSLSKDSLIDIQ